MYLTDGRNVIVVDTGSMSIVETVPVGLGARGIAATPDGRSLFVMNMSQSSVSIVNTETNTAVDTVLVDGACSWGSFVGIAADDAGASLAVPSLSPVAVVVLTMLLAVAGAGIRHRARSWGRDS